MSRSFNHNVHSYQQYKKDCEIYRISRVYRRNVYKNRVKIAADVQKKKQ